VVSFSSATYLTFPPPAFGLKWYEAYFGNADWLRPTWLSLWVALCIVAGIALGRVVPDLFHELGTLEVAHPERDVKEGDDGQITSSIRRDTGVRVESSGISRYF